ncbi:MAG: single-stranded DNA-binding protein [Bacteroidales bacterium]
MALNKVMLIGNLGKDPEVRHLDSGIVVASFSIATTERYKDRNSGELKENTEWHNIVCWRRLAETVEKYVHKGSQIFIEGKLRTRSYQDRNNPTVTRYTTEVVADNIQLLGRRSDTNAGTGNYTPNNYQNNNTQSNSYQGNSFHSNNNQGGTQFGNAASTPPQVAQQKNVQQNAGQMNAAQTNQNIATNNNIDYNSEEPDDLPF